MIQNPTLVRYIYVYVHFLVILSLYSRKSVYIIHIYLFVKYVQIFHYNRYVKDVLILWYSFNMQIMHQIASNAEKHQAGKIFNDTQMPKIGWFDSVVGELEVLLGSDTEDDEIEEAEV